MRNQYKILAEKYESVLHFARESQYRPEVLNVPLTELEKQIVELLKTGEVLKQDGIGAKELKLAIQKAAYKGLITTEDKLNYIKKVDRWRMAKYQAQNRDVINAQQKERRIKRSQEVLQGVEKGNWDAWIERILSDKWSRYPESNPEKNPKEGLTLEYIKSIWPRDNACPVFRKPFALSAPRDPNPFSPSIDKLYPEKGYIKGNIAIISNRPNTIKNNGTVAQINLIANWLKGQEASTGYIKESSIVNGVELDDKTINFINNVFALKMKGGWDKSRVPIKTADKYTPEQLQGFKTTIMPEFGDFTVLDRNQKDKIYNTIIYLSPSFQAALKTSQAKYRAKKNEEMKREYKKGNPEPYIKNRLLPKSKSRAKEHNIFHNVNIEDVLNVWPKDFKCPALNIPLVLHNTVMADSPSLDRINSKYGYIKNNIAVISQKANNIKSDASADELYAVANYMKKYNLN